MNTLVQQHESQPLRRAFLLDAVATGGLGLGLVLGAEFLRPWLELPVAVLRGGGALCVVFAAFLAYMLTRDRISRAAAVFAIAVNAAWVIASIGLLGSGWVRPNTLGVSFVIAQAAVVVVFAELQYVGMKRAMFR